MGDETRNWLLRWPCQLNQDCGPTICAKWDSPEIYAFERYLVIRPTPEKRHCRKLAHYHNLRGLTLLWLSLRVADSHAEAIFNHLEIGYAAHIQHESAEWCPRKLRFGDGADPIHLRVH